MRVSHLDLYAKVGDGFEQKELLEKAVWLYNKDYPKDAIDIKWEYKTCSDDIQYVSSLLNRLDVTKLAVFVKYCDMVIVMNKERNLPPGCIGERRIRDTERSINVMHQIARGELLWVNKEQEARTKRNKKKKDKREAKKLESFVLQLALKGQEIIKK